MIVFIRGLIFLTTLTLLGIYGLECFVLWPTARLKGLAKSALVGLLLATGSDLLLRSMEMTGSFSEGIHAIPPILTQTHVGHVWFVRGALVLALLLIEVFKKVELRWLRIVLGMALGVTIAMTGHAADHGDFTVHVLMDSLHVIAAGLWVGGLFGLAVISWSEPKTMSLDTLAKTIPRFSVLAGWCVLAVVMGGTFNAWVSLPHLAALWNTSYGRILCAKLLAASVLIACGAMNRYAVLPHIKAHRAGSDVLFATWLRREVGVALVVMGLTAVLCETIPARHAIHVQPGTADGTQALLP